MQTVEKWTVEKAVELIKSRFPGAIKEVRFVGKTQAVVVVDKDHLTKIAKFLLREANLPEAQLSTVIGIDERPVKGMFSVVYWISINAEGGDVWIGLKAYLPPDKP